MYTEPHKIDMIAIIINNQIVNILKTPINTISTISNPSTTFSTPKLIFSERYK